MTTAEQLAAYRSRHKIDPTLEVIMPAGTRRWMCAVDGLRVHARRSKGRDLWLHDADEIRRLVKAAKLAATYTESELRAAWGDR